METISTTLLLQKAERKKVKLKIGISGPSGSGKTYSALLIAKGIAGDNPICLIDTENRGEYYTDLCDYFYINFQPPYTTHRFLEALSICAKNEMYIVIIDSLTHAWSGIGGLVDSANILAAKSNSKNTFAAWNIISPEENKFRQWLIQSPFHLICTFRTKNEYLVETDHNGKTKIRCIGTKIDYKDSIEYEFTSFLTIDSDHNATIQKDCSNLFDTEQSIRITAEYGERLMSWMHGCSDEKEYLIRKILECVEQNGHEEKLEALEKADYKNYDIEKLRRCLIKLTNEN